MKFLLMVAKNYTEAFNALLDAYLEIGENIPQFTQYQNLFGSNVYMQTALAYIYEDILEFHKEALRYFRQRSECVQLRHESLRELTNNQHGKRFSMRHGAPSAKPLPTSLKICGGINFSSKAKLRSFNSKKYGTCAANPRDISRNTG